MLVYFVRHGEALSESQDKKRPLTEKGRMETYALADKLAASKGVKISRIYHSGKLRAKQTADIFASAFAMPGRVSEIKGIMPNDNISACVEALDDVKSNIMIVGHLPHLSKTVTKLACGDEGSGNNPFNDHGVVALERKEGDLWEVAAVYSRGDDTDRKIICL